jgi:hypothetical protein
VAPSSPTTVAASLRSFFSAVEHRPGSPLALAPHWTRCESRRHIAERARAGGSVLSEHPFVGSQIASLGADFQRAIQQGNLVVAESVARELGRLSLEEALSLLFLYAEKEPIKFERAALRWLARYVTAVKAVSLLKAQLALAALAELRAGEREQAAKLLTELAWR